jgi:hypothetical protein
MNKENVSDIARSLDIFQPRQQEYVRGKRYFGHFLV